MIMTDEQIKQNAEQYALKKTLISTDSFHGMAESYLEGAHSRDEEIYDLKRDIEDLQKMVKMRSDAFECARKEIGRLSNPWISVKDRLPKCCTIPSIEQYIKNKRYWDSKFAPTYLVMCSDKQGDYYQFANFIKFPEDKKPSWVFAEGYIKRNCATHWMPIPKVNKEK